MRLTASISALVLIAGLAAAMPAAAADIVIGTGSANGVYYQVGRAICRMVQAGGSGLSCEPRITDGSQFNLSNLRSGTIELGVVQSDLHHDAYTKSGRYAFIDEDYTSLRSLFSVHGEAFTVVVRNDSGITSFDDLKGKRVNLGNPGSGHRVTMDMLMAAKGWTSGDFLAAREFSAAEQVLALCQGQVQAIVYLVGHPNASIEKAVGLCGAHLIDVTGPDIDKFVADHPYYTKTRIPADLYPASPDAVTTFGVKATLVTTADVDEELVYQVVKAVFEDLDTFKSSHPAFKSLEADEMMKEGLTAPLHPGALRYYRENGMM